MAATGQGATLTFTPVSGAIRSITMSDFQLGAIEDSDLSTDNFKTYIANDLAEPGTITVEIIFDSTNALPTLGASGTVTVTFPLDGNTTAANFAGTGFVSGVKVPDLQLGELQIATVTIQMDGKTEPAFTAAT